jgi:Fe-S-cluster-containing dehydrogenase component/formate-dependent nitrite reductase membrane component NrfD
MDVLEPASVRFGFAIDHRSCIGCHACTVACKQEHGVELGVFRTWVKYIEQGTFPDARRYFSVLRCNHCDDAPCVEICPVKALYKRDDGIVDFDPEQCIGCKACLNACPYDALHIDPESHTAAKCNFCAHRVDAGLKPSCEVVCPTQAIVSGDLDDPESRISRLIASEETQVRAPEQGTGPNVYYVGANEAALDPIQVAGGEAYLTTEVDPAQREKLMPLADGAVATVMADVAHPPPWGRKVSSYFVSKGVAAGAMMLAPLLLALAADESGLVDLVPGLLALAGIAVTGVLLVADLKRPDRFYYLFTRPQWRSWLAIGAQFINLAVLLALAFTAAVLLGWDGPRDVLAWALVPAGLMLACYTAFLFGQCDGRDLWESPLLLPHTVVNALVAGAGALAVVALGFDVPADVGRLLAWTLVAGCATAGALIAVDLFAVEHPTGQAARAARNLWRDLYARRFWAGGVALGIVLPVSLGASFLLGGGGMVLALAGASAIAGMWLYEDAWVRAGQSVPLS